MKIILFSKKKRAAVLAIALLGIVSQSHNAMAAEQSHESPTEAPKKFELKLSSSALAGFATYAGVKYDNCTGTADSGSSGGNSGWITAQLTCNNATNNKPTQFSIRLNVDAYILDTTWLKVASGSFIKNIDTNDQASIDPGGDHWVRVDSVSNAHKCYTNTDLATSKGPLGFNFSF